MNTELLVASLFVGATLVSYYFWKTRKDKDYLMFAWYGLAAVIVETLDYVLKNMVTPPQIVKLITHVGLLLVWPVGIFLVLRILLKRKNVNGKDEKNLPAK